MHDVRDLTFTAVEVSQNGQFADFSVRVSGNHVGYVTLRNLDPWGDGPRIWMGDVYDWCLAHCEFIDEAMDAVVEACAAAAQVEA